MNDSLTRKPIFIDNCNPEVLIDEFVTELIRRQEIISGAAWKMYPMEDVDSLPERPRSGWTN